MYVVGWSLTSRCNLNCKHCYNASGIAKPNELNRKEAIDAAKEIITFRDHLGCEVAVNFGGGECPLRTDFIDLCKLLNNNGIKMSLTTNGTTYSLIKDNLELFYDIGVSLDFPDASRHDEFRGVDGTFKKATNMLEQLVEQGIENEVVTCITKINSDKQCLKGIYDLCKELKVDSWRLNRYRETGRGLENQDILRLTPEDLKNAYSVLAELSTKKALNPDPLYRNLVGGKTMHIGCPCGKTSCRIQPDGEVTPCIFLHKSGGNIKEVKLKDIFDSQIFNQIRSRKPTGKCIGCKHYDYCEGGCAGAAYLKYGNFNNPDPLCWIKENQEVKGVDVTFASEEEAHIHEFYLGTVYVTF